MIDELRDSIEGSVSMAGGIHRQLRPRRGARPNGGTERMGGVALTEIGVVGDGRESWAMISGWCRVKD